MPPQTVTSEQAWDNVPCPRVIRFTGAYCAPCKATRPAYEAAAASPALAAFSFWECDAEKQQALAERYGVRSIPATFVEVKPGRIEQVQVGGPLSRLGEALIERLRTALLARG